MYRVIFVILLFNTSVLAQQSYEAKKVESLPVIDGEILNNEWKGIPEITIKDSVAKHNLYFSAVHNNDEIVVKVKFPDKSESNVHKPLIWNKDKNTYVTGPDREDTVVLKWAIQNATKELRLDSTEPYIADIWYWKSFRTNPLGYADDKIHIYSKVPSKKAVRLYSKNNSIFYLQRKGDRGKSAYQPQILLGKGKDIEEKYTHRQPTDSRADILAKGQWDNGFWTVEFMRKLSTNNNDDVQLTMDKSFLLGISRYEIAGRKINKNIAEPLFGSGDIGELINLSFGK